LDIIEKKISNLIEAQLPQFYQTDGPVFVQFVKAYYQWLEGQQIVYNHTFANGTLNVQSTNTTISGNATLFQSQFANGDTIALFRSNTDYDICTINVVSSNTELSLTELPRFANTTSKFANTKVQSNPLYHSRRMVDYRDIDQTIDDFLVYFKEKYLKGIQFTTRSNTRLLVKHALDIYRSKGTERSIDLLFRLIFGVATEVYYPSKDIMTLSSGKWVVPTYLEISLNDHTAALVNKQIYGLRSGAIGFVEKVIRRSVKGRLADIVYIDPIHGAFETGESIDTEQSDFAINQYTLPVIIGSLTALQMDVLGSGEDFVIGDIVSLTSLHGEQGQARVTNTTSISGIVSFNLANGGYGISNTAEVLVSDKVLIIDHVATNANNNTAFYFNQFETVTQPAANIVYQSANGLTANMTGTVSVTANSSNVVGTSTLFDEQMLIGDYISVWTNSTFIETKRISNIANGTFLTVTNAFSYTNTTANYANSKSFSVGDNVYTYYSNGTVAGHGQITIIDQTNSQYGTIRVSNILNTLDFVGTPNANGSANVAFIQSSNIVFGATKSANLTGNISVVARHAYLIGDGTTFDQQLVFPSANISGTIDVDSATSNITGTALTSTFANGQYLIAYSNSTAYQTRQINTVVNSTFLTINQPFTFSNAAASAAKGFVDSYVGAYSNSTIYQIRQINSIVNATYLTLSNKFLFTNTITKAANVQSTNTAFFVPNANQTGTVAIVNNQQNVTGTTTTFQSTFAAGDHIVLFTNSTNRVIRTIESISSNTLLTLTKPLAAGSNASATFANVSANASFVYGKRIAVYVNSTSYLIKSVNAVSNDSALTVQTIFTSDQANSQTKIANTDVSYYIRNFGNTIVANLVSYTDTSATGNLIAYSDQLSTTLRSISSTFIEQEQVYQVDSSNTEIANAYVSTFTPLAGSNGSIALVNTIGTFEPNKLIRGRTSNASGNVVSVEFKIGLIDVEGTFSNAPYNYLVGQTALTTATVTAVGLGSGASFAFEDLVYSEFATTCDYIVGDFANVGLDALTYGFDNPTANLTSCTLFEALSFTNTEFGKIYQLTSINPGQDYTVAPFVVVYDRFGYPLQHKDSFIYLNGKTDNFAPGELITQSSTGARALVKNTITTNLSDYPGTTANTVAIVAVERLRLYDNSYFVATANSTSLIVGANSAASGNVELVVEDQQSKYIGINPLIDANVVTANGAVTSLEVMDSGFGFANGETITFTSEDGSRFGEATALVQTQGHSRGFYASRNGFLSDRAKLYDGYYYQQFSYDIQSPLTIELYQDMLKKTLHVAGTQMFGTYVYLSTADSPVSILSTEITVS